MLVENLIETYSIHKDVDLKLELEIQLEKSGTFYILKFKQLKN